MDKDVSLDSMDVPRWFFLSIIIGLVYFSQSIVQLTIFNSLSPLMLVGYLFAFLVACCALKPPKSYFFVLFIFGLYCLQSSVHLSVFGVADTFAVSFIVVSLIFFCSILPYYFVQFLVLLVLLFLSVTIVSNKAYYSLYQSYIPFSFTVMAGDSKKLISNVSIFYIFAAVVCFFILALVSHFLVKKLFSYQKRGNLLVAVTMFSLAFIAFTYHDSRSIKTFNAFDESPVAYFLRSADMIPFIDGSPVRQKVERVEAEAKALLASSQRSVPEKYIDAIQYFRPSKSVQNNSFPLQKSYSFERENKKNVIVIVLESVRASEMGLYNGGDSATPFLDGLAKENTWVKEFYSTASLTIKSETAINCSVLDFYGTEPASKRDVTIKADCLPNILSKVGYETLWFHGNDTEFYNRKSFHPSLGFKSLYGVERLYGQEYKNIPGWRSDRLSEKFDQPLLGWGIPDVKLFELALNKLEQSKSPFYAEILTVSNHLPFEFDWGIEFPEHLQKELTFYQKYRRGIYYTDYAVKTFFEKFSRSKLSENTIVVITGDHGIWTFDDSKAYSALDKHKQFFRSPLIIVDKDLPPSGLEEAASHVDIAPTILSMLGMDGVYSFMGRSLLDESEQGDDQFPIFMALDSGYGVKIGTNLCIPSNRCFKNGPECTSWQSDFDKENGLMCYSNSNDSLAGGFIAEPVAVPAEVLDKADDLLDYMNLGLYIGFNQEDML